MKKRKPLVAGLAIILAITLVLGGTLAYLYDSSDVVVNDFDTNSNSVELKETTGSEYSIVPGTTQAKDPTIYAYTTLESYVFLQVTDTMEGLVKYEINSDIWTPLDGYEGVYYTVVTEDSKLNVLVDDQVSYPATITNENMWTINEDGEQVLKDGLTLTFQAYVIQANPFADAESAYLVANETGIAINEDTGKVYTTLAASINDAGAGDTIQLLATPHEAVFTIDEDTEVTLDLNGHSIYTTDTAKTALAKVTLNGKLTITDTAGNSTALQVLLNVNKDSTLVVNGGHISSNTYFYSGSTVIINGGIIRGYTISGSVDLTINGGTFINTAGTTTTITESNSGTTTINGGVFDSTIAIKKSGNGTLVINDGSFAGKISRSSGYIKIYGGTFTGDVTFNANYINIYGGTFSTYPTAGVADGYEVLTNSDGTYTVAETE